MHPASLAVYILSDDDKNCVEDKDTTDAVAVDNQSYRVRNLNYGHKTWKI